MYGRENDLLFSVNYSFIFPISTSFALFFILLIMHEILLKIPKLRKILILGYKTTISKSEEEYFKKLNIRFNIFLIIFIIINLFFSIISFSVYLKINNSGIYYNKYFEFKERYYEWDELKSVSIYTKVTNTRGREKNLSPRMVLEFGKNMIDIWEGGGLGSPSPEILIKTIEIIKYNTNININYEDNFNNEILEIINRSSSIKKRNDILKVYNYLKEK